MVDSRKTKKIVLMGLDAAGKSSILLSLQNDTRLSSFQDLAPTIDVNRSTITDEHNDFFILDFGGQEASRKGYLRELDKHLEGVDKVIFVIDIQDSRRHPLALDYLQKIVIHLATTRGAPPSGHFQLAIFLHKYDPLPGGKENKDLELLARDLASKIARIVPHSMSFEIQLTSMVVRLQKTRFK